MLVDSSCSWLRQIIDSITIIYLYDRFSEKKTGLDHRLPPSTQPLIELLTNQSGQQGEDEKTKQKDEQRLLDCFERLDRLEVGYCLNYSFVSSFSHSALMGLVDEVVNDVSRLDCLRVCHICDECLNDRSCMSVIYYGYT
jgi:hypothetical protein